MRRWVDQLLGDMLVRVQRRAVIHSHGVHTPYPFQANTYGLPVAVVSACLLGYFRARERDARGESVPPRNFEDFIRQRMGDGVAEHFMLPYNTKLWTVHPRELSYKWCGRFVPLPKPEEVIRGALAPHGAGDGLGYNASFLYPKHGGIGRLAESLREGLPEEAVEHQRITSVDWRRHEVGLASGETHAYRDLVSTMPLDDLVKNLVAPPEAIREEAAKLRCASVTYWDVGVRRANSPGDPHWIYFPEAEFPFYRVGAPSAVLPHTAPSGHRSYYVETSHPRGTPPRASEQEVLEGLQRAGLLLAEDEVVQLTRTTLPCAYVIMDHAYHEARSNLLRWLEEQQIFSIGRYGAWMYDSMEGAMLQGRNVATRLNLRG